ncbi:putative virion structural protein [Salmonella phage SPFM20]|nr:putative virion structural protein [Salmonella phage SPFM20]
MQAAVHVNNNLTSQANQNLANHAAADNPHPNYLLQGQINSLKTQVINNTNAISHQRVTDLENQGKDFQQQIDNPLVLQLQKMVNDLQSALNETKLNVVAQNYQKMSLALANLNYTALGQRIDAIVASLAAWNDQSVQTAIDATINDIGDLRAADNLDIHQVNGLTETEIRALIRLRNDFLDALNTHINAEGNVQDAINSGSAVQLEEIKGILDDKDLGDIYGFEYIITVLAGISVVDFKDLRNVPDTFPSAPTFQSANVEGIRQAIASLKIEDLVTNSAIPTDIEVSAQVVGGFFAHTAYQKMTKNREVVMGVVAAANKPGVYPYKRGTDYELSKVNRAFAFPDGAFYADTFRFDLTGTLTSNAVTRRITLGSGQGSPNQRSLAMAEIIHQYPPTA